MKGSGRSSSGRRPRPSFAGCLIFVLAGPLVVVPMGFLVFWLYLEDRSGKAPDRLEHRSSPFTVSTFFEDGRQFTVRIGRTNETYDRTGERVLVGAAGCLAGARDAATRTLLSSLGCDGRIEVSFVTASRAQVSVHVLRLGDEAAGRVAEARLKAEGMRFVTAAKGPIGARYGDVGSGGRYAVVTAAVSPPQKDARRIASRVGGFIHAETTRTALGL